MKPRFIYKDEDLKGIKIVRKTPSQNLEPKVRDGESDSGASKKKV